MVLLTVSRVKLTILTVIIGVMAMVTGAQAANSGVGFEVAAVRSSRQVNQQVSYFDLKLKPGQTTNIAVKVKNTSDHAITVNTAVSKATTNNHGVVEYKKIKSDLSVDLPANFEQVVTTKTRKLHLAKGATKTVTYQVKMPKKRFSGVLVGGLTFLKPADQQKSKSAMAVRNQYSYTIATVLHGTKDLTKNNLTLGKVKASQTNGHNAISLFLENHTAAFLNQVKTKVKIYQRGGQKVVYQQTTSNGQMAPSSIYKLPLQVGQTKLKAGKYTAKVKVTSKKQHWTFTKDFTITSDEANKLNQRANLPQSHWLRWLLLGLLLLLLLLLLIWYIHRKQKRIKALEQQLKDKE
ncbi:cell surface protein [Lactobacillus sp.] [Lactiplantibacillus mudanjiangensis]|uniref:DUF916 and DUF3324 domain-containing protein n=1 Tax=Lactiplantibacillus mudanjiangensis TaxID=1296538 RepID=UPI001013FD8E|nr:cell surface protein [Lactobacillus sp.] [Lactiplantibacillus mudanjiangensis]